MVNQDRRNVLKAIGGAGALLSLGVGVAGAKRGGDRGKRRGAGGDGTIVDLAIENGFDVLAAAVTEAGLVDTLSGRRQLTVFAPSDAAFNAAGITVDTVDSIPTDYLVDVLTYHVVPGRRYASSVVNVSSIPTLNGAEISVDGTELNDGQANIVATDFEASNGVVHAIDGVLLPPSDTTGATARGRGERSGARGDETIVDVAVANDFNVLAAAATEAGLVETLSGRRQLTVFAPSDAAFNAAGITVDNVDTLDPSFLVDVLTYHVTPGRRYSPSVVNAESLPTLNGAEIAVDGTELNDGQANIVATDFEASNGVVHAIDGVLLP